MIAAMGPAGLCVGEARSFASRRLRFDGRNGFRLPELPAAARRHKRVRNQDINGHSVERLRGRVCKRPEQTGIALFAMKLRRRATQRPTRGHCRACCLEALAGQRPRTSAGDHPIGSGAANAGGMRAADEGASATGATVAEAGTLAGAPADLPTTRISIAAPLVVMT